MLDFLGHPEAGAAIVGAIERVLADPARRARRATSAGSASTVEAGRAIAAAI